MHNSQQNNMELPATAATTVKYYNKALRLTGKVTQSRNAKDCCSMMVPALLGLSVFNLSRPDLMVERPCLSASFVTGIMELKVQPFHTLKYAKPTTIPPLAM